MSVLKVSDGFRKRHVQIPVLFIVEFIWVWVDGIAPPSLVMTAVTITIFWKFRRYVLRGHQDRGVLVYSRYPCELIPKSHRYYIFLESVSKQFDDRRTSTFETLIGQLVAITEIFTPVVCFYITEQKFLWMVKLSKLPTKTKSENYGLTYSLCEASTMVLVCLIFMYILF